jgi:type I restriction enzyme S subunit
MSNTDKLLEKFEIAWIPLKELVTTITAPSKVKKNEYCSTGKIPIIDQGINFIAGYTDKNFAAVKSAEYVIFGDHSEHIKYVNFSFIQGADGLKILKAKVDNTKYLYYSFVNFYKKEQNYKRHWLSAKETLIPIPYPTDRTKSIEIQKEIVRVLDSFTELTAELTAELATELTARKQQYSYYREKLFIFDEKEVQHLPMGHESIGKFIRGGGLQKKDFTESGVGCIHYGQIYTYYGTYTDKTKSFVSEEFAKKARMAKHGDLVIATTSENDEDVCKAVAWLGDEKIAVSSDACFYTHSLNPKYVSYYFQTEQFQKQKRSFITGIKVRRVNADNLAKIKIPVPSEEEQERIVSILDKFDILTTSISEGLPKEIELRKKQYEYYRDMLLTFPKDNIEA